MLLFTLSDMLLRTLTILITACSASALSAAEVYKIFDGKPKTIAVTTASHGGVEDLQYLLKLCKLTYLTAGSVPMGQLDSYEPANFAKGRSFNAIKTLAAKGDLVFLDQTYTPMYQIERASGRSKPGDGKPLANFIARSKLVTDAGAKDYYCLPLHYTKHYYFKHGHQMVPPETAAVSGEWLSEINQGVGKVKYVDGNAVTAPYYPIYLGDDWAHPNRTRLSMMIRFKAWIETVSKDEGTPITVPLDIEALVAAQRKTMGLIESVSVQAPQNCKLGDSITITWKANPSVKNVKLFLTTNHPPDGDYVSDPWIISKSVPANPATFTWTIPTEARKTGERAGFNGVSFMDTPAPGGKTAIGLRCSVNVVPELAGAIPELKPLITPWLKAPEDDYGFHWRLSHRYSAPFSIRESATSGEPPATDIYKKFVAAGSAEKK